MSIELDDYRWLISPAAEPFLRQASQTDRQLVQFAQSLRKQLSRERTHLVIEQAELRTRAKEKFSSADRLFFTQQALEQATDERIAAYKAERFAGRSDVADLCCGIGGDLAAIGEVASATGIDADPVVSLLAKANADALGRKCVAVRTCDVREVDLAQHAAWHLDPDRRATGRRTTQLETYEPPLDWIDSQRQRNPHVAVKLAPATVAPLAWAAAAELCWIGSRRECRQQVAWWGDLARQPGQRTVVVFEGDRTDPHTFAAVADDAVAEFAEFPGRFLYEPHAAVLAAGLGDALATTYELRRLCDSAPYFTSDDYVNEPLFDAFEVQEVLPFDMRKLNAALGARDVGELEIKKRGVDTTPEQLRKRLKLTGTSAIVLLIVPQTPVQAILARRVRRGEENDGAAAT